MEHLVYDAAGQLLTGTLADYLMPTTTDFPRIRAVALEQKPAPHNPLGAKGAGEGGIIPVGGVIANAWRRRCVRSASSRARCRSRGHACGS